MYCVGDPFKVFITQFKAKTIQYSLLPAMASNWQSIYAAVIVVLLVINHVESVSGQRSSGSLQINQVPHLNVSDSPS